MTIPIWLMWLVSLMLAAMPLAILPIAMSLDNHRAKKRRAKPVEFNPLAACSVDIDYEELELLVITSMIADIQMRQRWDKDIRYIY